ncbi:hypothetical protein OG883_44375 [Streptomyces sp. NBC_01142]|uniref:hypothetical protein n=1 Tax=Streptomyces sp. NBC_01142 TaxID=2975865 RepID=UPI0022574C6B|nr:hypothetical protein [Streptomyces sp. NBC_01142]MCX4826681.1 hypothetical protein [Streptomyces sp. NBC_01142]
MADESDPQEETTEKVTVLPARPWPVYNVDRARAELIAIEMLTRGASYLRVRHATGLSPKNVRRLQTLVAEEAQNPAVPRIVCRTPARAQAVRPGTQALPRPPGRTPPAEPARPSELDESAEPVQMTLSLDC